MVLVIDNYDSFSYNLVDYLLQAGVSVKVYRNSESLAVIKKEKYQGVLLSPGPCAPQDSGNLMEVLDYYHSKLPVLGICLGHQAVGHYFGAQLEKASYPMHGKLSTVFLEKDKLFNQLPSSIQVTRYHSLLLTHLPNPLYCIAQTDKNEIMAIKHRVLPIYGIQFHPEAYLTQYGLDIIKNWVSLLS